MDLFFRSTKEENQDRPRPSTPTPTINHRNSQPLNFLDTPGKLPYFARSPHHLTRIVWHLIIENGATQSQSEPKQPGHTSSAHQHSQHDPTDGRQFVQAERSLRRFQTPARDVHQRVRAADHEAGRISVAGTEANGTDERRESVRPRARQSLRLAQFGYQLLTAGPRSGRVHVRRALQEADERPLELK